MTSALHGPGQVACGGSATDGMIACARTHATSLPASVRPSRPPSLFSSLKFTFNQTLMSGRKLQQTDEIMMIPEQCSARHLRQRRRRRGFPCEI